MQFRRQLTLGVGALIALTSCIGIVAIITLYVTTTRSTAVTRQVVDDIATVQRVRVHAEEVVSAARGYLLTSDDTFRERLADAERELESALDQMRAESRDLSVAIQLSLVEQRLLGYTRATANAARQRSPTDELRTIESTFEHQLEPRRQALDRSVEALVASERGKLAAEARHGSHTLRAFTIAMVAAAAIGIALSITLALIVIRRLASQYRRVQEAEAEAARAADARKQLLDIVAHDLRSPLNAIALGLEVLQIRDGESPYTARIKTAAQRMQRLVDDLLDVSRAEHGGLELHREVHRAEALLDTMCEQFRDRAERAGIELVCECASALEADVDRDRVFQILANLVGNALRVTRSGGKVVLAASERPDGATRFTVTDTGPGIAPETVRELFEPYHQGAARAQRGSLGLGLYICKHFVEAHGGQIGGESTPGVGTTFWFDIPAVRARAMHLTDR